MRQQILNILPLHIRGKFNEMNIDFQYLQEIRVRNGEYLLLQYDGQEHIIEGKKEYRIQETHLKEMLEYISQYSLYAYEQELKQGFITIEGGHRVGMTGKAILENGKIKTLKYINAMNIRISHEVIGCGKSLLPYIITKEQICHTLIISPPRCGKTTILRDLVRLISEGNKYGRGRNVGVVDERSEIGGAYLGIPQNHLGSRTDLLDACPKVEGMMMLIRSMAPEVIVVDEIGMQEEVQAMEYVMYCGCKLIASVHGQSLAELKQKPVLSEMINKQIFERYIVLGNKPKVGSVKGVYDGWGNILYEDDRK